MGGESGANKRGAHLVCSTMLFLLHDERHLMQLALTVVGPSTGLQRHDWAVVEES